MVPGPELTWEAWFTLALLGAAIYGLVRSIAPPDVILLGCAITLAISGILTTGEVFQGFINDGVLTIAALFVVAAALRETGALDSIGEKILGKARTDRAALFRLAVPVTIFSAFLNNTTIVAMLVPLILNWSRRMRVSASRLLMPISYLAILGGTCTLIGTSTHLVVNGMLLNRRNTLEASGSASAVIEGLRPMNLFELSYLGIPFALIGLAYILTIGRRFLPDYGPPGEKLREKAREYLVDLRVEPGCRLIGLSVEHAGLRHLPGLFLVEIMRGNEVITPVRPDQLLKEADILTFTGDINTIVDLERIPGLVPVADEGYERRAHARRRQSLYEAVISNTSPLIGKSIRESNFRAMYNAAVIAVHRGGQRLRGRVGDIVLRNGDTLLIQAGPHFEAAHKNSRDFFLVSGVADSRPVRHERAFLSVLWLLLLVGMLSIRISGQPILPIPIAAFLVAGLMVGSRCISAGTARQSVDWQTLIAIGASLALGKAVEKTGIAAMFANLIVEHTSDLGPQAGPYLALALGYLMTLAFTELMTNYAAVTLMFPVGLALASGFDADPRPFIMGVTYAGATSLISPLGYQTHLMVFGPGGYKFTDFTRFGLPLSIVLFFVAVLLIPQIWPF